MSGQDSKLREALEGVDPAKRTTLTKLALAGFAAPVVASFAMQGISIQPAQAGSSGGVSNTTKKISDARLKKDISRIASHPLGFGIYRFKFLWSDQSYTGVLAQEVLQSAPNAVSISSGGILSVDYDALAIELKSEKFPN
jgi:hypothetical protein